MSELFLIKPIPVTEQIWDLDKLPVVSVFNWSYNHVNFIRESIESILEQKTTFPIEIIIHDDASNDGTIEIIREYEAKYPRLFRNIIQKENQWSQGKSVMDPMFREPRGKYIALTHGDDYWTDPYKLQKQVDFLKANRDCSMCFHKSYKLMQKTGEIYPVDIDFQKKYTTQMLLESGWNIFTATILFRNPLKFPVWINECKHGDLAIQLFLSTLGNFGYINEFMSVYRKHPAGVSNNLHKNVNKSLEHTYHIFEKHHKVYSSNIRSIRANLLLNHSFLQEKIFKKLWYLIKAIEIDHRVYKKGILQTLKTCIPQKIRKNKYWLR